MVYCCKHSQFTTGCVPTVRSGMAAAGAFMNRTIDCCGKCHGRPVAVHVVIFYFRLHHGFSFRSVWRVPCQSLPRTACAVL